MKVSKDDFPLGWKQIPTPSSVQDSMLVVDRRQGEIISRRHRHPPTRPIAHPELRYYQSRGFRDDTHPVFEWLKDVPLDVIDEKLGDIVMELAEDGREVDVRKTANGLSKGVKKLGYKGALELVARVGYLLSELEKGE